MRKLILFCVLGVLFIFPHQTKSEENLSRGLFVMAAEGPQVLSSRQEIERLIDLAEKTRIKVLFIQIYQGNKAWFPSKIADSAPYEACLKSVLEDPLNLLIKQAHHCGIEVHAWVNILSLGNNKDAKLLKKYGADILTCNLKDKNSLEDYKIDNQYFLEPGDPRVRQELTGIVEEIIRAYPDLDGIQFDYLRYPDKNPAYGYTKINTERFREATGIYAIEEESHAWKEWKRSQVTEILKQLVKKTRQLRKDIQISATGCMPYQRAYYEAFQDWPSWLNSQLIDFVTVMDYSPDPQEFGRWILAIKNKVSDFRKVNIGIGAYKLGHLPEEFEQEVRFCEKSGGRSCVVFNYGSLLENPSAANLLSNK